MFFWVWYGALTDYSVAQKVVEERFGPNKVVKDDMLGSFIRNGLDKRQAEAELLATMFVSLVSSKFN